VFVTKNIITVVRAAAERITVRIWRTRRAARPYPNGSR
jgi:hypothetical protein